MSHNFGNNSQDGYQSHPYEYTPKWEKDVDQNPDHRPSSSASYYTDRGHDVLVVFQVKGLGVICMRATSSWANPSGKLRFDGIGIFTKTDIGYSPNV